MALLPIRRALMHGPAAAHARAPAKDFRDAPARVRSARFPKAHSACSSRRIQSPGLSALPGKRRERRLPPDRSSRPKPCKSGGGTIPPPRRPVKNPGEPERAAALSRFNRIRRRVRRIRGNFFAGELAPPEKKLLPCGFYGRNPKDYSKIRRGWKSAGGACSPATWRYSPATLYYLAARSSHLRSESIVKSPAKLMPCASPVG